MYGVWGLLLTVFMLPGSLLVDRIGVRRCALAASALGVCTRALLVVACRARDHDRRRHGHSGGTAAARHRRFRDGGRARARRAVLACGRLVVAVILVSQQWRCVLSGVCADAGSAVTAVETVALGITRTVSPCSLVLNALNCFFEPLCLRARRTCAARARRPPHHVCHRAHALRMRAHL